MLDLPKGGESRSVSLFTTAGAVYAASMVDAASTAASRVDSSCSTMSSDQFLNSNDQRWSSSGTKRVGHDAAATLSGGLSGIPASL